MADTSHLNTLFQAEFGTTIDLADIMRFVKERYDASELLDDMGATEEEVAPWVSEKDLVKLVGQSALNNPFDEKEDAVDACLTMIEDHDIKPDELFSDTELFDAVNAS